MLALRKSPQTSDKCTPNILPCKIQYSGPSKVSKRFWSPENEADGSKTAYFRGRKLRGKTVRLPSGYEGVVVKSTEHTLPQLSRKIRRRKSFEEISSDEDEEDETTEPVKILQSSATFDDLVVWGHDQLPALDDTYVKGVEEWIAFAEAIHSHPEADKKAEALS